MAESYPTIAEHLEYLRPGLSKRKLPPPWPPDVFAVCASLLLVSGAYRVAADKWPPKIKGTNWVDWIGKVGAKWRRGFDSAPPSAVRGWWSRLLAIRHQAVTDLCGNSLGCEALLQMLAASDEASAGAGVPSAPDLLDEFDLKAGRLLYRDDDCSSLCDELSTSSVRVLPKMHAPQTGLTVRSFSHHLALVWGNEIRPKWYTLASQRQSKRINLLVVPWPKKVSINDFSKVPRSRAVMKNLPRKYGFFEFTHKNPRNFGDSVIAMFQRAYSSWGNIDAVILPECAVTDEEYNYINSVLLPQGVYLVAGVRTLSQLPGTPSGNCVRYNIPLLGHQVPVRQAKHHRWQLNKSQIRNYRMESVLDPEKLWWEHIPVEDRTLNFVAFRPWMTMCALICEDLARPDPVGDLLRSVGPNLVIALLLDGPQLPERWPGRYATVLAEDPGCSVLTLTCAGMSALSRPRGVVRTETSAGLIAAWKDPKSGVTAIDISGGEAALLGIDIEIREEWTADGRSDGKQTGYPILSEIQILAEKGRSRKFKLKSK